MLRIVGAQLTDEQISVFFGEGWVITLQERIEGDTFDAVARRHPPRPWAHARGGRGLPRLSAARLGGRRLLPGRRALLSERHGRARAGGGAARLRGTACLIEISRRATISLALRRAVWADAKRDRGAHPRRVGLIAAETPLFLAGRVRPRASRRWSSWSRCERRGPR
jgi:hypothetical protein